MSATELKEKPIHKIRHTDDECLVEEISKLIELQEQEPVYFLNSQQKEAIRKGQAEIAKGAFLTKEEADKEIDEC